MSTAFSIALIQPPVWGTYDPPTALAQISSCLKASGYSVSVFDLNIELYHARSQAYQDAWAIERSSFWSRTAEVKEFFRSQNGLIREWVGRIAQARPDLIGLSVNTCSLPATVELARLVKESLPETRLAAGGPIFCVPADPSPLLDNGIDVVVRGEGEETFADLAGHLAAGRSLDTCRGLYFRDGDRIVRTPDRPLIRDLDALPYLDLAAFPMDRYDSPGHLGRHISLMTSRGCVQNCVFCGPRAYWHGFRTMSGKRIYDEIRWHVGRFPGIEAVEFLDLLFNGDMRVLNGFCRLMSEAPPKSLRWRANLIVRPDMDAAAFQLMKAAGCSHVTFGIESGSPRVLERMRKKYRIEDAQRLLQEAHGAGLETTCNFMFGFPGETEADFQMTLGFLSRNARYLTTAYPSRTYCTIEPHSYMAGHLAEFGIVPNEAHGQYWRSSEGANTYPERLRRCEEFTKLAQSLGVHVGAGLQTSVEKDKWLSLGDYYNSCSDLGRARDCFRNYLELDGDNDAVREKLRGIENGELG